MSAKLRRFHSSPFLRPWSSLFGLSDGDLRSLSFVFRAAAPLAVALAPLRGFSRDERLVWAAMVALWIPAIGYAQAAKPLALAYLLATLPALAFANLIRQSRPSIRSAALWGGLTALAIEAHYDDACVSTSHCAAARRYAPGRLFFFSHRFLPKSAGRPRCWCSSPPCTSEARSGSSWPPRAG
jgi:hypothetical protein